MALNLSTPAFSTKDQSTLHLDHPESGAKLYDAAGNPVEIVIYGKASKQYRNAFNAMQNRYINRGKKKPSAELYLQEAIELLVACSVRANNLELSPGQAIDTPTAFTELYSNPAYEWVKDQVSAFQDEVANFLEK